MRKTLTWIGHELWLMATCGMAACQYVPNARPISMISHEADLVTAAMTQWPRTNPGDPPIKRPLFATIHLADHRSTASGILEYYAPHDFRITAATEMGSILFDARMNWAGVTVLR